MAKNNKRILITINALLLVINYCDAAAATLENTIISTNISTTETPVDNSSQVCKDKMCIKKCCPDGKIYSQVVSDYPNIGCVDPKPNETKFEINFEYKDGRTASSIKEVNLEHGYPDPAVCEHFGPMPSHRTGRLLPDGIFYTEHDKRERKIDEYCLEVIRDESPSGDGPVTLLSTIICYTAYEPTTRDIFRRYAHSFCLIISIASLLFIILCHGVIAELRNLQGLCLLSHATCLCVGCVLLLTSHLWKTIPGNTCVIFGLVQYISYVATYLWLTVMCYDVWKYVRMSVNGVPFNRMGNSYVLYWRYAAVVWLITLLILTVTATLQYLPNSMVPDYILRPAIGITRCFIVEEDANLLVYFFGILGFLCLVNLSLSVSTILNLKKGGARICCWGRKEIDSESHVFNANNIEIFWNRFQIFVVTIFIWSTEVLSWKIPPKEMWDLTDLLNTLQGAIILFLFMRQKNKRNMVCNMIRKLVGRARETAKKITPAPETSSTYLTMKLENSDKETVEKIRKLSRMEETATSTILKSLSQNKIDAI